MSPFCSEAHHQKLATQNYYHKQSTRVDPSYRLDAMGGMAWDATMAYLLEFSWNWRLPLCLAITLEDMQPLEQHNFEIDLDFYFSRSRQSILNWLLGYLH